MALVVVVVVVMVKGMRLLKLTWIAATVFRGGFADSYNFVPTMLPTT
jgi:hypothetical protein